MSTVQLLAEALDLTPEQQREFLDAAAGLPQPRPETPTEPGQTALGQAEPLTGSVADAAERLGQAVFERWQREEELRHVQDPFPLPVRWRTATERVMDHWANICRVQPGDTAVPLDVAGRLADVVEVYRKIPSGRLVVLGRAGSGKTILTLRFVLDWLAPPARAHVVPVIFGLGSWNPTTTSFRDWLIDSLVRDYGLTAPGMAAALVAGGRILPVLDGFDEMFTGLRGPALERLNATPMPVVLTSRPDEYERAVKETDVLTAAVCVQLADLTLDDLLAYLPRTTRKTSKHDSVTPVWNGVLTRLWEHPDDPVSITVAAVFSTPLMVALARAIYSDAPDRDPAELLRFSTREAVEQHLLSNFIPTAYRAQPGPHREWDPDRARQWLGYLAQHLQNLRTHDIAWWELGTSMRRSSRAVLVALVVGLVNAVVNGLGAGLRDGLAAGLAAAGIGGLATAVGFGLVHGMGLVLGGAAFEPSRVRIQGRGRTPLARGKFVRRAVFGLAAGLGGGLVLGLAGGLGSTIVGGLGTGLVGGVGTGLVFGLVGGVVGGVMARFESLIDLRSTASPADLLRVNRTTVAVQSLIWGPVFGLVVSLVAGPVEGLTFGLVVGLGLGVGMGLSLTAWGQWLVLGRVWLPLRGRLPWSVMVFLDDACRRGVLRQSGAVYQFRHARLQEHLAA
jgi:hypothetical protein